MAGRLRGLAQATRFIVRLIVTDYDRVLTSVETALSRLDPSLAEGIDGDGVADLNP